MRSGSRVGVLLSVAAATTLGLAACGSAATPGGGPTSTSVAPTAGPTPSTTSTTSPSSGTTPPVAPEPSDPIPPPIRVPTRVLISVTGIPQPGVESGCLVLDAYVLIGGDRALLGSGVKLEVSGHTQPDLASYCQQGTLLVVDSARRVS